MAVDVTGCVVRANSFSANVFFFDILTQDDATIKSFVLKSGTKYGDGSTLDAVAIHRLTSRMRVGDVVEARFDPSLESWTAEERTSRALSVVITQSAAEGCPPEIVVQELPKSVSREGRVAAPATTTQRTRAPKEGWCKYWLNSRRCPLDCCSQPHPEGDEWLDARLQWHDARDQRRVKVAESRAIRNGEDPSAEKGKRPKSERADLLCDWLLEKIGVERLRAGSGVLDIAGGKGDVTLRLQAEDVPTTVVDPRRCFRRDGTPVPIKQQIVGYFGEEFFTEHEALLQGASLLLGMHPDQATEPLVDYALRYGKPFVVVPCCVFRRELGGHRFVRPASGGSGKENAASKERDNDEEEGDEEEDVVKEDDATGEPKEVMVSEYEDFLDYLQAKDPRIQRHFLNFKGRNAVLSILEV